MERYCTTGQSPQGAIVPMEGGGGGGGGGSSSSSSSSLHVQ